MRDQYFEGELFEHISLSEETVQGCEFVDCQFINCSFEKCRVVQCSFSECRFVSCDIIEVSSEYSQAKFLELDRCSLVGVNWSVWKSAGRFGSVLSKVTDCKIKYNTFTEMDFPKFDFRGSSITGSMFAKADLSKSDFRGCDLTDTEFFQCDLRKADFRNASGYKVDVLSCKVKDAKFSYPEAINLLHYLGISVE